MFGSGQWTIWEGYAALKLMKAGFRSNNLDPNARHCMASAAAGFMRTFGMDEPMGCYDDIEAADAFVLWGSNMAEMHPILWTRVTDRRLCDAARQGRRAVDLRAPLASSSPTSPLTFTPQTDLAILNYIANHIIKTDRVNQRLRRQAHRASCSATPTSATACGPSIRCRRRRRTPATPAARKPIDLRRVREVRRQPTTLDYASKLSRRAEEPARGAGRALRRPEDQGDVVLDHGLQPAHARRLGNNLVYNLHLLTGKISTPGNSPFSLTGQPSACGTAREVGTFSHRLPADMVVTNPEAPRQGRGDLEAAGGHDPGQARLPRGAAEPRCSRTASSTPTGCMVNNNMQAGAEHRRRKAIRATATRTTSSSSPTPIRPSPTLAADLILPTAMWVEKEGAYGNAERRTHSGTSWSTRPARRAPTSGSWWSSPSASRSRRSGRPSCSRKKPEYRGKTLYDVLFRNGQVDKFPAREMRGRLRERRGASASASTCRRACSRSTPSSAAATATTSRRSTPTTRCAACAGRWSTARRPSGATARAPIPM